jgi:integrase
MDRECIYSLACEKAATVKESTINRYLALIRAILRRAARLNKAPFVRLYPEPSRRVRWLLPEQAKILMELLPKHQCHAMLFALSTGLRAGNVLGLRWNQVDLNRRVCWLFGDQTKNGEDLSVSLNDKAIFVLNIRKGIDADWVFTYQGKPVKRLTTKAWYKALKLAGIRNFRWHDLRHTWASWLV